MTDEEKFTTVGKVVVQHEQAKQVLATAKEQGKRLHEVLAVVAAALNQKADIAVLGDGVTFNARYHIGAALHSPTSVLAYPAWSEVEAVLDQIDTLATNIKELEARRKQLGV